MAKNAVFVALIAVLYCSAGWAQDSAVLPNVQKLLDRAEDYGTSGDNGKAYETLLEAKRYANETSSGATDVHITIERNLGEYARRMANLTLARQHYQTSIALVSEQPSPDLYQLYQTYTSLGTLSWYASKLDSAAYFYEKAIDVVAEIDDTPLNTYYRRALLYNNVAGVYSLQGKTSKAIQTMEECITLLQKFYAADGYEAEKQKAIPLQFEAIDNLGGAYKELGNYAKSEQLLLYAYEQKQKHLQPNDPALFISQILLGQLYYEKHQSRKALQYLEQGRTALRQTGSDYLFWDADACYTLALVYEKMDSNREAANYYRQADSLYHLAFGSSFDSFYLDFLAKYANFHARGGQCGLAIQSALNTLRYVGDAGNQHSLLPFYQLRNLAELSLQCKSPDKAQSYAQQALSLIDNFVKGSTTLADSIKAEGEKAKVILIHAKADYILLTDKNEATLTPILHDLYEAAAMIERKKNTLTDQQDIVTLISDYRELTDFIKQLNFELYEEIGDRNYLLRGINVHENNLYSRMRARMDYQNSLQFVDVPPSILEEEKRLKNDIHTALQQDAEHRKTVAGHQRSLSAWQSFLQKLEKQYPHYYQMRYAEKTLDLDRLNPLVADGVTVIRYVFSADELFALVMNKEKQVLVRLETTALADRVAQLRDFGHDADKITDIAYALYLMLWAPIANEVSTERVVIIPDGILYDLSFEMLTPTATKTYAELAQKCLLNTHRMAYHYSLPALYPRTETINMKGNFVAFAPDFSEKAKQAYLAVAENDSLNLDRSYLSLLPLPFTAKLVADIKDVFGGTVFSENRSTAKAFREASAYHRIIHIGTHAEANNDYPEYSRLIFAKDGGDLDADNSIYLYDLYNLDLISDLSVLTACESGRSGYQHGEGMVSMAHAFNYAGSRSILTGMWKLDEQSTAMITEYFYTNLRKGLRKDDALQQAKLRYLKNAEGRMLSPVYWAGLVIMGDTEPVEFDTPPRVYFYSFGLFLLLLLIGWWGVRASLSKTR